MIAEDKRADPGKGGRAQALHSKLHVRWPCGSLPSHAGPGLSLHHFAGVFSAAFQWVEEVFSSWFGGTDLRAICGSASSLKVRCVVRKAQHWAFSE